MPRKFVIAEYEGHDTNLAVVGEGRIYHFELERFTRRKHDSNTMKSMVNRLLDNAGISLSEIVACGGVGCGDYYSSTRNRVAWSENLAQYDMSSTGYFGKSLPCTWIGHHMAHACYSFYTSPYETADVGVWDAGGDAVVSARYPVSTTICTGVGTMSHAFGSAGCDLKFNFVGEDVLISPGAHWAGLARTYFGDQHAAGTVMALTAAPADTLDEGIPLSALSDAVEAQQRTNRVLRKLIPPVVGVRNICLAGGVALNGLANYHLLSQSDIGRVHIPPAVHDGGLAVGAALFVLHAILQEPRIKYDHSTVMFTGWSDDSNEKDAVDVETIVNKLVEGEPVAICVGRAESGPRALGHRSILSNPATPGIRDRINQLKGRQKFRPVAPVMLKSRPFGDCSHLKDMDAYSYMTVIPPAPAGLKEAAPAAVHYDNTMRIQLVEDDHILGRIIKAFGDKTGLYCILNTSLNGKGEPIVNTRAEAEATAGKMGIQLFT